MLFKVNPTKQNIQTEQGALVVTGNCYVQLHTPLRDMRRFKVLIKQKGKKEENQTKARVIPLWETRNKTAWHQSPPKETHTHTHSHTNARCIHTRTLTSSDYWAVAVTPLIERVSVSEEKYNICRPRELLGREKKKKKSTARDHPGNMCVNWWPVYHVYPTLPHTTSRNARYNTEKHSTLSVSALFWCTLWQCLLYVMCKK